MCIRDRFDTAFHQTMPEHAYLYAIPYELYKKYGVRRYGFHGTSHRYVSQRVCEYLGIKPEGLKLITCHIGNGGSIAAIKDGKCIDTSMGLTPLEGLMMGTRSGDIDAGAVTFIMDQEALTTTGISNPVSYTHLLTTFRSMCQQQHSTRNACNSRRSLNNLKCRTKYITRSVAGTCQLTVSIATFNDQTTQVPVSYTHLLL